MTDKSEILNLKNFKLTLGNKTILNNLNLVINENEIHILMGPNGSGKTSLSKFLTGHLDYNVVEGSAIYLKKNLLNMSPEVRSNNGIFLAFQYPPEISGVTNYDFLRIIYNQKKKNYNQNELNPIDFFDYIIPYCKKLEISEEFLMRNFNEGFSGGEKKKNEILQMLLLDPKLIILDEIDSGLDIDAIKVILDCISNYKGKNSSFLVITHNPKILQYLRYTNIHILLNGNIIKTGNYEVVESLEQYGYDFFTNINSFKNK